jgi:hypothetical protein
MRSMHDEARIDGMLADFLRIECGTGSSTTGIEAAHPPLATTRTHVEAGKTSTVPASANGLMNARTRSSSLDSMIM